MGDTFTSGGWRVGAIGGDVQDHTATNCGLVIAVNDAMACSR